MWETWKNKGKGRGSCCGKTEVWCLGPSSFITGTHEGQLQLFSTKCISWGRRRAPVEMSAMHRPCRLSPSKPQPQRAVLHMQHKYPESRGQSRPLTQAVSSALPSLTQAWPDPDTATSPQVLGSPSPGGSLWSQTKIWFLAWNHSQAGYCFLHAPPPLTNSHIWRWALCPTTACWPPWIQHLPLEQYSQESHRKYLSSHLQTCSPYTSQSQQFWCAPHCPRGHCLASSLCGGRERNPFF